jgi:ribose transport system ATP-binding protein
MTDDSGPILELRNIAKRFGATRALSNVNLDLRAGEVHALMGENGAGKSTLMKILSGAYQPDDGSILIDGQAVSVSSPRDAAALGISVIHQELNTVPAMTVAENLALGREPSRGGVLNRRAMVAEAREKLAAIRSTIDPTLPLGQLSTGMQQMVEIARAASDNARILVLDEPTASLSRSETRALFEVVNAMRDRGVGLIYISHRMEEVWELADRVTVLRDGEWVGTKERIDITPSKVVSMMVGRDVNDLYSHTPSQTGEVMLRVDALTDGAGIGPASFAVRKGEVVCLAGLIGAGRTELARMIFGADRAQGGSVHLDGNEVRLRSPLDAITAGMGMVPESRKEQGLFLDLSVKDNISISALGTMMTGGVIRRNRVLESVKKKMVDLRIRSNAINLDARSLSGGNQQKLIIARWLLTKPKLLILDEPTRGVDIGAKSEIYSLIDQLANEGVAILVVSSDLPEVIGISDRILVMREGSIVAEIDGPQATEENVIAAATGTSVAATPATPANGA